MTSKFLNSFGFSENPFASTNADKEPSLSKYFVPPPYFTSVKGDPRDPKSNVILAPRGGGKTAQKVMIEEFAEKQTSNLIYCVTYDSFRHVTRQKILTANLDWHLDQIIQRLLSGILAKIQAGHGVNLSGSDKKLLSYCFNRFLGSLSAADAEKIFSSVKSSSEHISSFFATHGKNIVSIVSSLSTGWGFGPIDITTTAKEMREEPSQHIIDRLISIIRGFGYESVYILIDRVDEVSEFSNDASLCFQFLKPILTELHLMETPHMAFKVFLWDQTEDYLTSSGFRRDRIPVHLLNWTQAELEDMLTRRLDAFSDGKIKSLGDMTEDNVRLDIHKLVCMISMGSPRDVIRLVGRIIDEHTRVEDTTLPISKKSIDSGIRKYSRERALELYGSRLDELGKIGQVSFTIGDLANDIFRISHQAARNKIQNLMNVGAVIKSGELENPGNRPLHQYSLSDPRIALTIMSSYSIEEVLEYYCFVCPKCSNVLVREGDEIACDECALEFHPDDSHNMLSACKINIVGSLL